VPARAAGRVHRVPGGRDGRPVARGARRAQLAGLGRGIRAGVAVAGCAAGVDRRMNRATRSIGTLRWLARTAARAPLTVASVVVLWGVGAATGSLVSGPPPELLRAIGAGLVPL